jgi:quinol-cytochrome oxidoreductase complex cytochrome b subunit
MLELVSKQSMPPDPDETKIEIQKLKEEMSELRSEIASVRKSKTIPTVAWGLLAMFCGAFLFVHVFVYYVFYSKEKDSQHKAEHESKVILSIQASKPLDEAKVSPEVGSGNASATAAGSPKAHPGEPLKPGGK